MAAKGKKVWPGGFEHWPAFKEAALCQLAADPKLTAGALSVGIAMIKHLNQDTLEAYPSQATLRRLTNRNRSTVQRGIKLLLERGHFEIIAKGGGTGRGRKGGSARYRFILKSTNNEKRAAGPPPLNSPDDASRAAPTHVKGREGASKRAAPVPPEPKKEPFDEPIEPKKIKKLVGKVACEKKKTNRTDFSDPAERQAFARRRIAEHIGPANDGWDIVMAAESPDDPNHEDAKRRVTAVAKELKLTWKPV